MNEVFPHAFVEIRGKVRERKAGKWNHRKGWTFKKIENKGKLAQLETEIERLKYKYSQKKMKIGKLITKNICHLSIGLYSFAFSISCVLLDSTN